MARKKKLESNVNQTTPCHVGTKCSRNLRNFRFLHHFTWLGMSIVQFVGNHFQCPSIDSSRDHNVSLKSIGTAECSIFAAAFTWLQHPSHLHFPWDSLVLVKFDAIVLYCDTHLRKKSDFMNNVVVTVTNILFRASIGIGSKVSTLYSNCSKTFVWATQKNNSIRFETSQPKVLWHSTQKRWLPQSTTTASKSNCTVTRSISIYSKSNKFQNIMIVCILLAPQQHRQQANYLRCVVGGFFAMTTVPAGLLRSLSQARHFCVENWNLSHFISRASHAAIALEMAPAEWRQAGDSPEFHPPPVDGVVCLVWWWHRPIYGRWGLYARWYVCVT